MDGRGFLFRRVATERALNLAAIFVRVSYPVGDDSWTSSILLPATKDSGASNQPDDLSLTRSNFRQKADRS